MMYKIFDDNNQVIGVLIKDRCKGYDIIKVLENAGYEVERDQATYKQEKEEFFHDVVTNSYKCQHCKFKFDDDTCDFAHGCLISDFSYWEEDD